MALTLALVLAALVTSTVSGVVGMAGGAMLLGVMVVLGLDPIATIPIHAAVQLISNGTRTFAHRGYVRWRTWLLFATVSLPFPVIGLWLVQELDRAGVRAAMGLIILYAVWAPRWGLRGLGDRSAFALAGGVAGTFGVVVGAVGPLIAPFFLRESFDKRSIIGTKAACQGFVHIIKIAAFSGLYPAWLATASQLQWTQYLHLILPMGAATVAGTYLGRAILARVSEAKFVVLYKVVLTLLAARLIVQALD